MLILIKFMIIKNQQIEITISNNAKLYEKFGYKDLKQGVKILVPIHHLPENSQKKVKCLCDSCGIQFDRQYQLVRKENIFCYSCSKQNTGKKSGESRKIIKSKLEITETFDIKLWITQNCFRKDGKIISHSTKIEWFGKNNAINVYDKILYRTRYLPESSNFLQRYYDILHDITDNKSCKICNSNAIFLNSTDGYSDYCSHKCSSKDNQLNHFRIEESKKTILEKFGVDNCSKIPEIKQKLSEIAIEKSLNKELGVYNHLTDYQKWLLDNPAEIYKLHIETETPITILSKQLGFGNSTLAAILQKNNFTPKIFSGSFQQKQIYDWLKILGLRVEYNDIKQFNNKKELDIFLPDFNLAIEVNGLFWHGETNKLGKDLKYHLLEKSELCEKNNIELLHFYDSEIIEKFDIVKSIILNKLNLNQTKIFARKCEIRLISSKDAFDFYTKNHIQTAIYCKYNYGLIFNDELISCIGISQSRNSNDFEIIRFCNKLNTSVIGGFSRLLKFTINTLNITDNLISYVDKRIFDGKSYNKQFELIKKTVPNFYYFNKSEYKLESRQKYQKHKLQELYTKGKLKIYDPKLSCSENLLNNGYYRIYDCGNLLFRIKF